MDKETFLSKIKGVGSCEDDVQRRKLLTEIEEEIVKVYDNTDLLKTTNETLTNTIKEKDNKIQEVQGYNMELWLKLDSQKSEKEVSRDITGIEKEPEKTYKSYDELANEFFK